MRIRKSAVFTACVLFAGVAFSAMAADGVARDGGVAAVLAEQNCGSVRMPPELDAMTALEKYAREKGYRMEWDEENSRLFVPAQYEFNTPDPALDKDFAQKRENAAQMATLLAKGKVLAFISADMSAEQKLNLPDTEEYRELHGEYSAARDELEMWRTAAVRLTALYDRDAADALAKDGTEGLEAERSVGAALAGLDGALVDGRLPAARRSELDRLKAGFAATSEALRGLVGRAEAIKGRTLLEYENRVEMFSKMSLSGVTVVQQAESWDAETGMYQVAVLACWSEALGRAAENVFHTRAVKSDGNGQSTIGEWLDRHDLGAMIGPRQFLDKNGQKFFVGISAWPTYRDSHLNRVSRDKAALFARATAAYSLFCDMSVQESAKMLQKSMTTGELDEGSMDVVAAELNRMLNEQLKDCKIPGFVAVRESRVLHPISGKMLNVAVYAISPESAAAGAWMEKRMADSVRAFDTAQAGMKEERRELDNAAELNRALGPLGYAGKDSGAQDTAGTAEAPEMEAEAVMAGADALTEPRIEAGGGGWRPSPVTSSALAMSGDYHTDP